MPEDRVSNARAGVAVAIGVDGVCHRVVGLLAAKKLVAHAQHIVVLDTAELYRSGDNRLGALGLSSHHEHGLAERRRFLLESAAVGHHHVAARHEVVHLVRAQRVDEVHARRTGKELLRVLAHDRAEVHGIDQLAVFVLEGNIAQRGHDVLHGLTVILAAVAGDEHDFSRIVQLVEHFRCKVIILAHRCFQCVNDRIARDEKALGHALFE